MHSTTNAPKGHAGPCTTAYIRLRRAVDALDAVLMFIGCMMLFLLMLVVVADVLLRYLFNAPLLWSHQVISTYLMPGLFFLAVSHTLKSNAHVGVDILHNYVTRKTRYVFEAATSVLAAPVFFFVAVVAAQRTVEEFHSGATLTSGLAVPSWTTSFLLPLGFGLLALRLALNAAGYAATLASGREVAALPPISGSEEVAS